jgi:glycosyltransferase involved in cell wall biosynthesis
MACGLPVVASPVGVNVQIVKPEENGYLATTVSQWKQALGVLLNDGSIRRRMGAKGRQDVEAWYSMQVQAPRIEVMMRNTLERS